MVPFAIVLNHFQNTVLFAVNARVAGDGVLTH